MVTKHIVTTKEPIMNPSSVSRPAGPARFRALIDELFFQLEDAFVRAGWSVEKNPAGGPPGYAADFVVEKKRRRYVAEVRIAREPRRPELPALLADAYVRASVGARAHNAKPLAIVGASLISDELARELADYANRFFADAAWGFIDGSGRIELHGAGLDVLNQRPRLAQRRGVASIVGSDIFSDLGQWMAKVLLASSVPSRYLDAPRDEIAGSGQLAKLASVSAPSASRFVRGLKQRGFLAEDNGLRLIRREAFLRDWQRANRGPRLERACQWLLPSSDPREKLGKALRAHQEPGIARAKRAALGLFSACDRLGLGFVKGAPQHLYLEDLSDPELERLGLVPAGPGERVDVFVREPVFPESVFRGAVQVDGLPVADVLQCWLDVADHPVRGAEQAEHIWRKVFVPNVLQPVLE